jgi:hypothetical protein
MITETEVITPYLISASIGFTKTSRSIHNQTLSLLDSANKMLSLSRVTRDDPAIVDGYASSFPGGKRNVSSKSTSGIYARRVIGGDCHYWHLGGAVVARRTSGARSCPSNAVQQQSQATWLGLP